MRPFAALAACLVLTTTPLAARAGSQEGAPGQAPPPASQAQPAPEPKAAPTLPVSVYEDGGILMMKTPDSAFRWWLDGRMMLDSAVYLGGENSLANGAELRRGRIGFRMVFWKDWAAKFEVDFADSEASVKDMWIAYVGLPNAMIKVGQYTEPFCLDSINSSRYITFMERGVVEWFQPERHLGISYSRWGRHWQASAGLFSQEIGEADASGEDQAYAWTGRVTATPFRETGRLLHLGLAASYRTPHAATDRGLADSAQVRFRARPETHVNRGYLVDTGRITEVDHTTLFGLEAAGVLGPVSFQSEYKAVRVDRTGALADPGFSGWYAGGSWFPTGEVRPYDFTAGDFARVIPKRRRGALELGVRYSVMDLNDPGAGIRGGREAIATAAVNWYANANIRVMLDCLRVSTDQYAVGDRGYRPNDRFFVVQTRLQLHF